jgi:glutaminase
MFEGRASASVVRRTFDGSVVRSKRRRPPAHAEALRSAGRGLRVIEVQGPFQFGSTEELSRRIATDTADASHLILDVGRVTSIDAGSLPVLEATLRAATERGLVVAIAGRSAERFAGDGVTTYERFDAALERCEDELLETAGVLGEAEAADLVDHELLAGMSAAEVEAVIAATTIEVIQAGSRIFEEGAVADSIYFLLSGRVCVVLDVDDRHERIATIGPGGCFGEMAIVDGGVRSASVDAETEATCRVLPIAAMARLEGEFPGFSGHLCRNLAVTLSGRLRDANEEVRALRA